MGKHRQQRVRQGAPAPAPTSAEAQEAQQPTISQRTEQEQLELAVDLFYQKMMDDPAMEPFFRHIDMARQRHKIANFMLYTLGGSEAYTGRDIYTVHRHMVEEQGLRKRHFDLVLKHMTATLQELGATPELIATACDTIHATLPLFRFPPDGPKGAAGEGGSGGSSSTGGGAGVSSISHAAGSTSGSTRAGASTSSEGAAVAAVDGAAGEPAFAPAATAGPPSPAGSSGGGSEAGGEWMHVRLQPLGGATGGVAVLLSPQPSPPASDTEAAVGAAAELSSAAVPSAATAPPALPAVAAAPSQPAAGPRPASPAKPPPAAPAPWPLPGPGFSRLRSLRGGVNQLLPQLSGQWHAGGGWQGPAGASLAVAALAAAAVAAHLAVWCVAPGPPPRRR